jgi:CheY-like chemotaxis protein
VATCTILSVEDDHELQEIYAAMLEETGCQIIRASGGQEAWDKLQETTPDLILLDMILDGMMGDQLFARIKQSPHHKDIPIVLITVLSAQTCRPLLEMDPRTLFLRKPFQKEQILEVANRGLDREYHKE